MSQHQPDGHGALYALPYVTRFLPTSCLRPRPVPAGRGPLFYLHPGGSPESQAKERQQRQDDDAFHGGQLLYPCGSMRRVSAWSDRVTGICVQRGKRDSNKKAARRRQALNAKIPPDARRQRGDEISVPHQVLGANKLITYCKYLFLSVTVNH